MENQVILFVAFSHTLTEKQVEDFKLNYGKFVGDLNYPNEQFDSRAYEIEIVTLKEVDPLLQNQVSNVPADSDLSYIKELAKAVVAEAIKVKATHFYVAGEPTLVMWCNLYASQLGNHNGNASFEKPYKTSNGIEWKKYYDEVEGKLENPPLPKSMVCIQSTTERKSVENTQADGTVLKTAVFKHVQWRRIF